MNDFIKLAPYASLPEESRGRHFPEPESATRSCHQRDRDRIIHSAAFRRLQYKTQVFVNHEGDFFRTRLTHSLEVAQIARTVCRYLNLNQELAEALALAHDLGHPPFGHAGEDALDTALAPYGGFDHNAQSLRVITELEQRYADFDGLNLTWETVEGVVKHNGPLLGVKADHAHPVPQAILDYDKNKMYLDLANFSSLEAQIAALSDDIAYNNHDIDDALRARLIRIEDLNDIPVVGETFRDIAKQYPDLDASRMIYEAVRRLIGDMVNDLLQETQSRIKDASPKHSDDIRQADHATASFSERIQQCDRELKAFMFENVYRHYKINRMTSKARRVVQDLFALFTAEPNCLPTEWYKLTDGKPSEQTAKVVADYIAGITDRYALDEHSRLFDVQARNS
ncbi:deoxyguanosinetriphosphate triphosphohydrolase [Terasakiella pusilla]|uniref:deoxyguanosinetriphosphate triphosphohydrolase n=1 Tax=Terasakiella pusilla TaxID=64973 RepID=UPI000491DA1A|nr:deoxyguanosinetriphosphate triphosphohydrolase [Terasakiella pusilla]